MPNRKGGSYIKGQEGSIPEPPSPENTRDSEVEPSADEDQDEEETEV